MGKNAGLGITRPLETSCLSGVVTVTDYYKRGIHSGLESVCHHIPLRQGSAAGMRRKLILCHHIIQEFSSQGARLNDQPQFHP